MKILIADKHMIVAEGLKPLISEVFPDVTIIYASDIDKTIQHLNHLDIYLVICDVNMAGGGSFDIIRTIRTLRPDIKILVFSIYSSALFAGRYINAGADAYVRKNARSRDIGNALKKMIYTEKDEPDQLEFTVPAGAPKSLLYSLSNRELEVAQLLIEHYSIGSIANFLKLHTNTVGTYKARIFEKVGVFDKYELRELFEKLP